MVRPVMHGSVLGHPMDRGDGVEQGGVVGPFVGTCYAAYYMESYVDGECRDLLCN